jgi:hypothetical protein
MEILNRNKYIILLLILNSITLTLLLTSKGESINQTKQGNKSSEEIAFLCGLMDDIEQIKEYNIDSLETNFDKNNFELFQKILLLKNESIQMRNQLYTIQNEMNDSLFHLLEMVNNSGKLINVQKQKDMIISSLKKEIDNKVEVYDSLVSKMQDDIVKYQTELNNIESKIKNTGFLTFKSMSGASIFYVGEINNSNKAEGYGIAIWETGHRYEGQWFDGLKHGKGVYSYKNGEKYEGDYKNNLRSGTGKYYFTNGDYYVGSWENDQREGVGKIILSKGGEKQNGIWEKDKFVK